MTVINVLYDITVLVNGQNYKFDRTGIYWTAYNILQQFIQNENYKVTLFSSNYKTSKIKYKLPIIVTYDTQKYKYNLTVHKKQIIGIKNIFILLFRYLQIIKNQYYIILLTILKNINKKYNIDDFDIFVSPVYPFPDSIIDNKKIKTFHILHDCIPVLNNIPRPDFDSNFWHIKLINNLNKETIYFCNSNCTKKDYLNIENNQIDKNKIFVTPFATSKIFFPEYNKNKLINVFKKYKHDFNPDKFYIFSLCTIDPRKNLLFTIKCFLNFIIKYKIENLHFFLGGGYFPEYYKDFIMEISKIKEYRDKIAYLGYIDDNDINILYSNSLFFVFLSQYEGFGTPPLEAMQAGTTVICSNNSSLPEVVGDAAITIDYDSEEQCLNAFEKFYFNSELRNEYIKKGLERSKLFSWEKTFDMMSKIIIKTVSNNG
jgi:glycosyltransferase involved in cell wall biosynthesis